jgi:hypothetical protein
MTQRPCAWAHTIIGTVDSNQSGEQLCRTELILRALQRHLTDFLTLATSPVPGTVSLTSSLHHFGGDRFLGTELSRHTLPEKLRNHRNSFRYMCLVSMRHLDSGITFSQSAGPRVQQVQCANSVSRICGRGVLVGLDLELFQPISATGRDAAAQLPLWITSVSWL